MLGPPWGLTVPVVELGDSWEAVLLDPELGVQPSGAGVLQAEIRAWSGFRGEVKGFGG